MEKILEYYFDDGSHVKFVKYTIDASGVIRNNLTGKITSIHKTSVYNVCNVKDDCGNPRKIRICRALLSTFEGRPPTLKHTADHIDRDPNNDTIENLRWLCKRGQGDNRNMPEMNKSAFIVIKDDVERTVNNWIAHLKDHKNQYGRLYTRGMINQYAQKKKYGFSYKDYPDLSGEVWKRIAGSETTMGYWKISNMNRIKFITKYAENVLSGERLGLSVGYPKIAINGQVRYCHILSFMTFFPDEYAAKKPCEIVLHEDDDKLDFRPHKLRLGTNRDNGIDAYDNGKHDDAVTARMKCASYINGILEKQHLSQSDAVEYLRSIGFKNAKHHNISTVLSGDRNTAYGRTWKKI